MKKKIMIIDDSKTFHAYITKMLGETFELSHIENPLEAIENAKKIDPELFLIDLEMPHMNGKELSLKLSNEFSATPIIMMTGSFTDSLYIDAIEAGANDILSKSASESMIINKINSIIKHKELIQKEIKLKQLDAVTALIATSNHEFNNTLFISNQYIKKLKVIATDNPMALTYADKISEMNERILAVVNKLSHLEKIEIDKLDDTNTSDDKIIPMLKI